MLSNYQDHKVVLQEEEAFVVEHYMYTPRGVYIELHAVYGFCSAKKIAIFLFMMKEKQNTVHLRDHVTFDGVKKIRTQTLNPKNIF